MRCILTHKLSDHVMARRSADEPFHPGIIIEIDVLTGTYGLLMAAPLPIFAYGVPEGRIRLRDEFDSPFYIHDHPEALP